jgi:preprotein translocase subunit SecB
MAENETPVNPAADEAGGKQVLVTRIYVKDCSFESPRAPAVFFAPLSPEVKVNMRTASQKLDGDDVEVVLSLTVEAQSDNRALFLVEVHHAGVFSIRGFTEAERAAILGSYCPSILFPYARETVSDLVSKGGMPALLLQPVNFDAVYMQSLAQPAGPGTVA